MAKKNEFKPDKPRAGLLSRLYLTKQQRLFALKWILYGLVLLILSVLQDVVLCHAFFYGATTNLVPCGIFLICILEGLERGSIFTLIAAVVCLFSGAAPGPYCIALITFWALAAAYFRHSYLQKSFSAVMLCTGGAMILYEISVFVAGLFLQATTWGNLRVFFLTGVLSTLIAPVLYPVLNAIGTVGGDAWKE